MKKNVDELLLEYEKQDSDRKLNEEVYIAYKKSKTPQHSNNEDKCEECCEKYCECREDCPCCCSCDDCC